MQNNDNQTNQKDPQNRGQNGFEYISPGLCSIWLERRGVVRTFDESNPLALEEDIIEIRRLLDETDQVDEDINS